MAKKKLTLEEKMEEAVVTDVPYEVPRNWVCSKLGAVCNKVQYGYTEKASIEKLGPHFLRITDIQENEVDWDSVPYCPISKKDYTKYKLDKGDIVIARTGATTGKNYIISDEVDAVFASYLIRMKISNSIYNKFISYYMYSDLYWKQIMEEKKGIAQPGVNAQKLGSLIVPIPPLKEQQRIVDRIESLFEKLDKAKELIEEARVEFEKRKSAIVYKIMNQYGYEKIKLKSCIRFVTDKKEPVDGYAYIGLENIGKSMGIINYSVAENVKSTKTKFSKGDILYGRLRPYLDKHDVVDRGGICSTDILVMRPNENFDARYINYILGTLELIRYANENSSGINLPRVSAKALGEYEILNIEFDKQKRVVTILNMMFEHENKIEELTTLEDQIELIKKSILAKAFRSELGTNDPNEESALELLKEILSKE